MASHVPDAGPATTLAGPALLVVVADRDSAKRLPSGVDYDIVPMTYRGSRSAAKQEHRIAEQASHLARRRHATWLPDEEMPATAQLSTPRRASYVWSGAAG